jgi:short-subunit dehydrogenase
MSTKLDRQGLPWKRVWVTGAGRGIGAALARLFCEKGLVVYASSRTHKDLNILQKELALCPGKIIPIPLDICNTEEIDGLIKQWKEENTFPELVVLNAGTHDPFPATEFSAERCRKLLDINLMGTINCLDPVLKYYLEQDLEEGKKGQIAVMASVAGYRGLPTAAAYGASKAALIHLCESLWLDLSDSGVKLQVINPGFVRTPLTDKNTFTMPDLMEPEDAAKAILKGLQADRFEIAFPTRFVCVLKLLRLLPYSCYFWLARRITG